MGNERCVESFSFGITFIHFISLDLIFKIYTLFFCFFIFWSHTFQLQSLLFLFFLMNLFSQGIFIIYFFPPSNAVTLNVLVGTSKHFPMQEQKTITLPFTLLYFMVHYSISIAIFLLLLFFSSSISVL
jgi:hypothetical protein